jgi:hypothetical protein
VKVIHSIPSWAFIRTIVLKSSTVSVKILTDPSGESFVEPKFVPPVHESAKENALVSSIRLKLNLPIHGDEVSEPLMGKFVSYDIDNSVAIFLVRGGFVEQHGCRAIGYQAPILHGTVRLWSVS